MPRIPFNRACLTGRELDYIKEAVELGHISGNGPFSRRCERWLEQHTGARRAMLTHSGTAALEMAALLLNLEPGDEFLVPSFTFVSTANAFVLRGARPVFVDIRPDTLNMDEALLAEQCTDRTRVIVPVHYGGVGCEMDAIDRLAAERGVAVVEDNAHGLLASYKGRPLGSFGCLSALSFHETKNFSSGEGGALLVNDPALADRAEIMREKGTDRSRLFRGEVDRYTWLDYGSSYIPSDILAAFLFAQLEEADRIQRKRERIWERYREGLAAWAARNGASLPQAPAHCRHASHLFYVLMPDETLRDALLAHLKKLNILAIFHYLPLHLSRMGRLTAARATACPVTESVSARLLRLPFYNDLTESDQDRVIEAVQAFAV